MRRAFIAALAAGLTAVTCGMLVAVAAAVLGRLEWAAEAGLIAAGAGAAVFAAAVVHLVWRRRFIRVIALVAASVAAASVVGALGFRNVTAMAAGVEVSCAAGLGSCEATGQARMPLLLDAGPVQAHPVIRLIVWGATSAERAVVDGEENVAPSLGQPLLEDYYGVQPATDEGSWAAPGDPGTWLRRHHQAALFPSDLKNLIDQARTAEHWPDTTDTQYWLATDLTAAQIGIGPGACADHVQLDGLKGAVVRLPFGSCTLPATRDDTSPGATCRPLAVVGPGVNTPKTIEAGIDIFSRVRRGGHRPPAGLDASGRLPLPGRSAPRDSRRVRTGRQLHLGSGVAHGRRLAAVPVRTPRSRPPGPLRRPGPPGPARTPVSAYSGRWGGSPKSGKIRSVSKNAWNSVMRPSAISRT